MPDLYIFEDENKRKLFPLAYLLHTAALRCGILTLREKILLELKNLKTANAVFINSRVLIGDKLANEIKKAKEPCLFARENDIIAAIIPGEKAPDLKTNKIISLNTFGGMNLPVKNTSAELISYPWDLICNNSNEIVRDIKRLKLKKSSQKYANVVMLNKSNIYIGEKCKIKPGVVLDAEAGAIVIDDGVQILANSVIMGPAYIGKQTVIKAVAKIYGGTSIGPLCKVGGEVEASIFQGYSNKQHDGFLGHSFIGEWVNLGADTNNSDLKNNYRTVKTYNDGKIVDSGLTFLGLIMGDHSKSGINTMFNTGAVVGVSCNVFGAELPPKFVPSFSWGGEKKFVEYDLEKALETAKAVMKRRNIIMTKEYEERFRKVFEETKKERVSIKL